VLSITCSAEPAFARIHLPFRAAGAARSRRQRPYGSTDEQMIEKEASGGEPKPGSPGARIS